MAGHGRPPCTWHDQRQIEQTWARNIIRQMGAKKGKANQVRGRGRKGHAKAGCRGGGRGEERRCTHPCAVRNTPMPLRIRSLLLHPSAQTLQQVAPCMLCNPLPAYVPAPQQPTLPSCPASSACLHPQTLCPATTVGLHLHSRHSEVPLLLPPPSLSHAAPLCLCPATTARVHGKGTRSVHAHLHGRCTQVLLLLHRRLAVHDE